MSPERAVEVRKAEFQNPGAGIAIAAMAFAGIGWVVDVQPFAVVALVVAGTGVLIWLDGALRALKPLVAVERHDVPCTCCGSRAASPILLPID
jgi:hypothetical protein